MTLICHGPEAGRCSTQALAQSLSGDSLFPGCRGPAGYLFVVSIHKAPLFDLITSRGPPLPNTIRI
jgi:hypothetical protein